MDNIKFKTAKEAWGIITHCQIAIKPGVYLIEDLEAENWVLVNENRLTWL